MKSDVPVLFVGKQPELQDLWDDGEGSFARIKKYRLPEKMTVSTQWISMERALMNIRSVLSPWMTILQRLGKSVMYAAWFCPYFLAKKWTSDQIAVKHLIMPPGILKKEAERRNSVVRELHY